MVRISKASSLAGGDDTAQVPGRDAGCEAGVQSVRVGVPGVKLSTGQRGSVHRAHQ